MRIYEEEQQRLQREENRRNEEKMRVSEGKMYELIDIIEKRIPGYYSTMLELVAELPTNFYSVKYKDLLLKGVKTKDPMILIC